MVLQNMWSCVAWVKSLPAPLHQTSNAGKMYCGVITKFSRSRLISSVNNAIKVRIFWHFVLNKAGYYIRLSKLVVVLLTAHPA